MDNLPAVKVQEFIEHLKESHYDIRRDAIVAHAGVFETYTQCWALNELLAKLEAGVGWSHAERRLAQSFSPERESDDIATVPRILQAMPQLQEGLGGIEAFTQRAGEGEPCELNGTQAPSALDAIRFWRAVRNNVVHRGGLVSARFLKRHATFVLELNRHYSYMEPMAAGSGFKFYDDVGRAMAAVHYRAAKWMNEHLESVSSERRGHLAAPKPKLADVFVSGESRSPLLLVEGDHELSYRWVTDAAFRSAERSRRPA